MQLTDNDITLIGDIMEQHELGNVSTESAIKAIIHCARKDNPDRILHVMKLRREIEIIESRGASSPTPFKVRMNAIKTREAMIDSLLDVEVEVR